MPLSTKITSKYQITLPKEVRKALGAAVGNRILFAPLDKTSWKLQVIPGRFTEALAQARMHLSPADFRKVHEEFEEAFVRTRL